MDATGVFACATAGALSSLIVPTSMTHSALGDILLTFGRRCPIKHLIHFSTALAVLSLADTAVAEEYDRHARQNTHSKIEKTDVVDTMTSHSHPFTEI